MIYDEMRFRVRARLTIVTVCTSVSVCDVKISTEKLSMTNGSSMCVLYYYYVNIKGGTMRTEIVCIYSHEKFLLQWIWSSRQYTVNNILFNKWANIEFAIKILCAAHAPKWVKRETTITKQIPQKKMDLLLIRLLLLIISARALYVEEIKIIIKIMTETIFFVVCCRNFILFSCACLLVMLMNFSDYFDYFFILCMAMTKEYGNMER